MQGISSLLVLPLLRTEEPETVLYNGNILTMDEAQPRAQAAAISGARFVPWARTPTYCLWLVRARVRLILPLKPYFRDSTTRTLIL